MRGWAKVVFTVVDWGVPETTARSNDASTAPMSQTPTRARPRWSVAGQAAGSPASMAGELGRSGAVGAKPPKGPKALRPGSAEGVKPQEASVVRLWWPTTVAPPVRVQSLPGSLSAKTVLTNEIVLLTL